LADGHKRLEAPDDDAYALGIAIAEGAIDHREAATQLASWRN
jgi:hypothetical protein